MHELRLSFWHMLLPALGLHGLLLAYPIDSERDLESKLKPGKPVRVITLPPLPRKAAQPVALKSVKTVPPSKRALPSPPKRRTIPKTAVASSKVSSSVVSPKPSPTPLQPSPAPTALQPLPTPMPSVPPVSGNELQMEGATAGCSGSDVESDTKDCFALTETNGRLVVHQIEEHFRNKGYSLEVQTLEDEHGMMVYQLSKPGHTKDYLHVFWDEKGTAYLRSSKILNHQELALIVRQESS